MKRRIIHISTILDKLGLRSRYEAAAWLHKYFPDDLTEMQGEDWY